MKGYAMEAEKDGRTAQQRNEQHVVVKAVHGTCAWLEKKRNNEWSGVIRDPSRFRERETGVIRTLLFNENTLWEHRVAHT